MISRARRSRARQPDVINTNYKEHTMNEQATTPITDVMTIGVPVTDQDRALEFYLNKLGSRSAATFRCSSSVGAGSRSHLPTRQ